MDSRASKSPDPQKNPEPILPSLTYETPVTPTFVNIELNVPSNNQRLFNSPTTSEFNNAAFMLMSNIDNNNQSVSQSINVSSPSYFLNLTNTPPSPSIPTTSALDFDSIGQLLMSPNNINGANNNIENIDTNSIVNTTTIPDLNVNDIFTQSMRFNGDSIFKDFHPIVPQSFNPPILSNNRPSLMSALASISTVSSPSTTNAHLSTQGIGLDLNSTQNTDLLSNTEALALESFLDSIANEGVVKSKSKLRVVNSKKRNNLSVLDTVDDQLAHTKQETSTSNPKAKRMKKESIESDTANKKQLSRQERKAFHNITEQKRRNMIKEAFDKLNSLVQSSVFDLQDHEILKNQVKKRKRKSTAVNKRPMKKFEVLSRSVREIQILVEKNNQLYNLLNETEKENPSIHVNDKFPLFP